MKEKVHIYYDEEGDLFELQLGKPRKGYFRDIGRGISERIDEKTGKVIGIMIIGFRKRMSKLKEIELSFPFKTELISRN
ncbi:hypothetical protein HYT58_00770 [Candidatus Woesearchaeota archaeon]|nr:hypothetical protein [Candidatus Woesearchaeota archaeon]